jgi:hypothetical protein
MFLYYQGKEQPAAAFTEHLFGISNGMVIAGSGSEKKAVNSRVSANGK